MAYSSSQETGWWRRHLRKLRLCDGDFWRDTERAFALLQTVDCLSYMKATDLRHEGVNLDKWHDLFLLKEVFILMVGSLCFSLKELSHESVHGIAC